MNYRAGSRIRYRLYAGREVDGVIRATLNTGAGTKFALGTVQGTTSRRLVQTILFDPLKSRVNRKTQTFGRPVQSRQRFTQGK
jgi:hypothetical protein